jgi:ParE toxin of type II toxin-antitoxin system, parDE
MTNRIELDPGPEAELDRLEKSGRLDLLERIEDAIDALAADPGSRESRRRAFRGGTFGITVRDPSDDWLIIWESDDDVIVVRYIGLDPFA